MITRETLAEIGLLLLAAALVALLVGTCGGS